MIKLIMITVFAFPLANAQYNEDPPPAFIDGDGHYWQPTKTTCKENLSDAIHNCVGLMQNAIALQNALQGQINTLQAESHFYQNRMEDADLWYRQPEFVGPVSALITLFIVFTYQFLWRRT